ANRRLMMERMREAVVEVAGDVRFEDMINIAHNYAAMEHHFRKDVMIHRKGATRAYKGQLGIIPGSQGTASYIVQGRGEPESFMSCSHGAGRKMGRKQAQKELDLATEKERLAAVGVIHGIRNSKDLDEAPGAYKDISVVMENQRDLVDIQVELRPLAVIKG
ncbi:MAG: RtcB family protein, partial [Candidatus Electrothrix sp. EH2]|nr:RtcB family protein [Candidatus Electrothrix sp. EH2]